MWVNRRHLISTKSNVWFAKWCETLAVLWNIDYFQIIGSENFETMQFDHTLPPTIRDKRVNDPSSKKLFVLQMSQNSISVCVYFASFIIPSRMGKMWALCSACKADKTNFKDWTFFLLSDLIEEISPTPEALSVKFSNCMK